MGLNSSYFITIDSSQKELVSQYLKQNCQLSEEQSKDPFNSRDVCLGLLLTPDSAIKKYIRGYYRGSFGSEYQTENLADHLSDAKVKIGCVDISWREAGSKLHIEFVCVSSPMSFLFAESESIRKWFTDLCILTNAEMGVFDCENEFLELFWFRGNKLSLQVDQHWVHDTRFYTENDKPLLSAMKDLVTTSFDHAYNHKR